MELITRIAALMEVLGNFVSQKVAVLGSWNNLIYLGCLNGVENSACRIDVCGALLPYPANDPNTLGFASGTFYEGSTIYPG